MMGWSYKGFLYSSKINVLGNDYSTTLEDNQYGVTCIHTTELSQHEGRETAFILSNGNGPWLVVDPKLYLGVS